VLGFPKLELLNNTTVDAVDRPYQFKFVKIMSKSKGTPLFPFFPIQEHPTEYQLRQFGEYMDRSMDSQPDPRTQFDPDAWQRQVLDKIDRDESILVVAPTSAGWVSDIQVEDADT
jgi:superfamily II RNA helicase